MMQPNCGEIGPGNMQFVDVGLCTAPEASMMVTDLTVTGFVPMFITSHSTESGAYNVPVEMMAACAVPLRIIPARTVHTLRDMGLLLVKVLCRRRHSEYDASDPFPSAAPKLGWQLRGASSLTGDRLPSREITSWRPKTKGGGSSRDRQRPRPSH